MPMIKRLIYIGSPCRLSAKNGIMKLEVKSTGEVNSIPIDDIGYLELDHPQIIATSYLLQELMESSVAVVFCDKRRIPNGLALPFAANNLYTKRFNRQISAKQTLKNNLWKQIVQAKIRNQACALEKRGSESERLRKLANEVKSGDSSNKEAAASKYYWGAFFPEIKFKRARFGDYPNNLLNYGYAILRAVVARALALRGLNPSAALRHKNQYNPYCLADDIMEPYRPFVDLHLAEKFDFQEPIKDLNREAKAKILPLADGDVLVGGKKKPLQLAALKTCVSLNKCYAGKGKKLILPSL